MVSNLKGPSLGYLTICRDMGVDLQPGLAALEDNMRFAAANGYQFLEVAAFPSMMEGDITKRDFYGETVNVQWVFSNIPEAQEGVKRLTGETGVALEAICYCANTIGNEADYNHVRKCVDVAEIMGIPNVVTFIGNLHADIASMTPMKGEEREAYFRAQLKEKILPMVERAASKGVNIAIENCAMRGAMGYSAQSLTSNWFSCPAEWDIVLDEVPGLKMWFDPSHLRNYRPQNAPDPSANTLIANAILDYGKHFAGCHLKDGEDDVDGMARNYANGAVFGDNSHTGGLWIARMPGKGQIYWNGFEAMVRQYAPQANARSVELEDLDVKGREANEQALKDTAEFYKPILRRE